MGTRRKFVCLGRHEHCEADWREPDRYRDLLNFQPGRRHIVQGAGLSLVGAGFGEGVSVTGMRRFDRILGFDQASRQVRAEAGITLGKLYSFLRPRGLCVPVQPGYPGITLGGCIAGNVHGKNQPREGVFADIVDEIELYHPLHGTMQLTRRMNPELFEATCGGFGLTGLIVSATIGVKPVPGGRARLTYTRVGSLAETAERMMAMRDEYDLLYSWNDLGGAGAKGGGLIASGRFLADEAAAESSPRDAPLDPLHGAWPFNAYNRWSLTLLNGAFAAMNGRIVRERVVSDFDVHFPFASKELYFHAYGRGGFIEHQVLVPTENALGYLRQFEKLLRGSDVVVGLATFKVFKGTRKLLWYSGTGLSFAIHVPACPKSLAFLAEVDRLDLDHQAIANVIKDARLSRETVRKQYSQFDVLRDRLHAHDPGRMFESALSRRIGL